ncbi:type IV secretory system conjugative DNA transfer family protein [Oceanobacillus luteolus]|uniref:Type IV secretory system conjugative DNA transfer family protein n=1 Tax=Oceanobacillus luteolus TaxID=1274358 RepID=A0ABW4HWP1_9BACI
MEKVAEVAKPIRESAVVKKSDIKSKSKWNIKNVYLLAFIWIIINFLWTVRNVINYLLLMIGQFMSNIPMFIPFGNPIYPSFIGFALYSLSMILMWLVFTKLDRKFLSEILDLPLRGKALGKRRVLWLFKPLEEMKYIVKLKKEKVYLRLFLFLSVIFGISMYFIWYTTSPVYLHVLPFFLQHITTIELNTPLSMILVGNPQNLLRMFMFIPFVIVSLLLILLWSEYSKYKEAFNSAFDDYEFSNRWLQSKIKQNSITTLESNEIVPPDVVLGPNSDTKELVYQPGKDRTLNNIIIGSIGTGKTAALVLPLINQDLHWMTRFINHFPNIYQREDFKTEEVQGMYLNGISVIEPSNDLCQKAFQLVKAHGIPSEAVYYIDPTNPETPSINVMQGPVDKVAEAFAMVIEGLAEGGQGNFFFQQSERNHLKHYIYLLKLHKGKQEDDDATFDKLLDMYNNAQLVRKMHVQLKQTFPEVDIESIEDRDERNHWKIVQQIDEWFDNSLLPRKTRQGQVEKVSGGKYHGEEEYYDAKAEYVQGLRNILNDIGASNLLRRVLFGKSNFNMDKHLEYGGILLVNTAKGELGELSNVLGKLVLLSLQNAVFRRKPDISTYHHIIVDEFPDFVYRPFKEFPAQSRKYKTIVTVVAQTITQLADKYGTTYMHTLLGTLRHKLVYGDIPDFDAEVFSKIFGQKEYFEEGTQEQEVSPLQEDPVLRTGSSYTRTKDVIMSPSDIIFQKEFQAAVKIVNDNRPMPVVQIDANFVPREEFKEAVISVDEESGEFWLRERNQQHIAIEHTLDEAALTKLQQEELEAKQEEEERAIITEIPKDIPIKSYPVDIEEDGIDEEIDNIVQFPRVVSHDEEADQFIEELKETFSPEPVIVSDIEIVTNDLPEQESTQVEDLPESKPAPLEENSDEEIIRLQREREKENEEKEKAYQTEQERLEQAAYQRHLNEKQKVNKNIEYNLTHNDFLSSIGVEDAED